MKTDRQKCFTKIAGYLALIAFLFPLLFPGSSLLAASGNLTGTTSITSNGSVQETYTASLNSSEDIFGYDLSFQVDNGATLSLSGQGATVNGSQINIFSGTPVAKPATISVAVQFPGPGTYTLSFSGVVSIKGGDADEAVSGSITVTVSPAATPTPQPTPIPTPIPTPVPTPIPQATNPPVEVTAAPPVTDAQTDSPTEKPADRTEEETQPGTNPEQAAFQEAQGKYQATQDVDIRTSPDLENSSYLQTLTQGSVIDVVGKTSTGWYVVILNGVEAFIPGSYLEAYQGEETKTSQAESTGSDTSTQTSQTSGNTSSANGTSQTTKESTPSASAKNVQTIPSVTAKATPANRKTNLNMNTPLIIGILAAILIAVIIISAILKRKSGMDQIQDPENPQDPQDDASNDDHNEPYN